MKLITTFLIAFCMVCISRSQQTVDLFIVEGGVSNGSQFIPYFTFNTQDQFDSTNVVLRFGIGDEVTFNVTNRLDFTSGFSIQQFGGIDRIAMGETKSVTITFDQEGTYMYSDPNGDQRALGLGGMLVVSDFDGPEYYGVFTEHSEEWIEGLAEGGPYNKKSYHPDVFTINGFGFPRTMSDPRSMIMGHVGDTIRIHMTNAGQMYHFPHFHGYHVKIIEATKHAHYVGWMKDSFGMAPEESITVELIPDKPGHYPMHNHNLVTTTIGGNYPGGMMMHLNIHE